MSRTYRRQKGDKWWLTKERGDFFDYYEKRTRADGFSSSTPKRDLKYKTNRVRRTNERCMNRLAKRHAYVDEMDDVCGFDYVCFEKLYKRFWWLYF